MSDLGEYLREQGGKRRQAGTFDCVTIVADWCIANGYPDPMAHQRGAYDSEDAAQELIGEAGGLVALFDEFLGAVGIVGCDDAPQPGDIGVVNVMGHEAGGVFTGERWALVGERGIALVSPMFAQALKAWKASHG